MTLSSLWAQPCHSHLECDKCIYGYLYKMKDVEICVHTQEPDYSDVPEEEYDWAKSVYGDVSEHIPKDAPERLEKYVTLSHYINVNLYHDMLTGHSITSILHFLNKMPIDWYSKKQATMETLTYRITVVAACTCVNQIVDLRFTLHYLSVPIYPLKGLAICIYRLLTLFFIVGGWSSSGMTCWSHNWGLSVIKVQTGHGHIL